MKIKPPMTLAAIGLAVLLAGCQSAEMTKIIDETRNCQAFGAFQAETSSSASQRNKEQDEAKWGPLASLVGPWWVTDYPGVGSVIHKYEWSVDHRFIRRMQINASTIPDGKASTSVLERYSKGQNVTLTFERASEPGVFNACDGVTTLGVTGPKSVYRLRSGNELYSEWDSPTVKAYTRNVIRVTLQGGYETRVAVGGADAQSIDLTYTPFTDTELAKQQERFNVQNADFQARYKVAAAKLEQERIQKEREEAERAREERAQKARERDAFWGNVVTGLTAVTQATAQVYAEQQASRPSGPSAAQRELAAIKERERLGGQRPTQVSQQATLAQQPRLQPPTSPVVPSLQVEKVAAPAKSLSFVLIQGMEPGLKATVNPSCVSNVITVAGPPGWGNPESNDLGRARAIVESYFPEFVQKCSQTADGAMRTRLHGQPTYVFNDSRYNDPQTTYNQYRNAREHSFVSITAR